MSYTCKSVCARLSVQVLFSGIRVDTGTVTVKSIDFGLRLSASVPMP